MNIQTAVFRRIVEEAKEKSKQAAIMAIADTMQETIRFGWATREYVEGCAERRLQATVDGKPWPPKI